MPLKIVDTHIHIWNFEAARYDWLEGDTSILNRSYHLNELEPERIKAGITEGVLVQATNNLDGTAWMLKTASENTWITGVVGWLPLVDPAQTATKLEQLQSNKLFKGVRHLIHNEPDPKWLLQAPVLESLQLLAEKGVTYDIVGINVEHLKTALIVAEKIPTLNMVFDHCNQPPIATGNGLGEWGNLMEAAATHPQFFTKISGLGTTSNNPDWSSEDIVPYVEFLLNIFGIDRCFCGGDWPVSLLAGSYVDTWGKYRSALSALLTEDEQEKVLFANAKSFYKL